MLQLHTNSIDRKVCIPPNVALCFSHLQSGARVVSAGSDWVRQENRLGVRCRVRAEDRSYLVFTVPLQ